MPQIPCPACADGLRDQAEDGGVSDCPVCGDPGVPAAPPDGWLVVRHQYWILDGTTPVPVGDVLTWGAWFETADRTVARTQLGPDVEVSSVFLGVNHQWGAGPPLLFETMVFRDGSGGDEMWRYATWAEALEGHEAMVEQCLGARDCGGR